MCEFLLVPQNVTFCGTCTTSEPESREPELSTAVFTLAVCTHTVCVHTVQTYCLIYGNFVKSVMMCTLNAYFKCTYACKLIFQYQHPAKLLFTGS